MRRPLDIRAAFALSKSMRLVDVDAANDMAMDAIDEAYQEGIADGHRGNDAISLLFTDEPALRRAWQEGQDFAAELAEMAACPGCHDDAGRPCVRHG